MTDFYKKYCICNKKIVSLQKILEIFNQTMIYSTTHHHYHHLVL